MSDELDELRKLEAYAIMVERPITVSPDQLTAFRKRLEAAEAVIMATSNELKETYQ